MTIQIADPAPRIALADTAGVTHALPGPGEAAATVVVWTCNHCPYALAWHQRLEAVTGDYASRDVRFFAINSNDAKRYPGDSLEAMAARAEAGEFAEPFLHDPEQSAAHAFGAERTPDVFVFGPDALLAYRGAPDADWEDPSLDAAWLRGALDAILAGKAPEPALTRPVGCTIKWLP